MLSLYTFTLLSFYMSSRMSFAPMTLEAVASSLWTRWESPSGTASSLSAKVPDQGYPPRLDFKIRWLDRIEFLSRGHSKEIGFYFDLRRQQYTWFILFWEGWSTDNILGVILFSPLLLSHLFNQNEMAWSDDRLSLSDLTSPQYLCWKWLLNASAMLSAWPKKWDLKKETTRIEAVNPIELTIHILQEDIPCSPS